MVGKIRKRQDNRKEKRVEEKWRSKRGDKWKKSVSYSPSINILKNFVDIFIYNQKEMKLRVY